jgi:thioredoxin 1
MKKVYKFSAAWCGPCKMLTKTLSSVESPVEIEEVDIDANPDLTRQYNIRGVPTLVLVEDNAELKRKVGIMSGPEFLEWVNS